MRWMLILGIMSVIGGLHGSVYAQQYCTIGEERLVEGCHASCKAGWNGSTCPMVCTSTPPPGFVILNHKLKIISSSGGGHSLSRIASGQEFKYKRDVEEAYNQVLRVASQKGNDSVKGKISEDMRQAVREAESFSSSHQMVRLQVNAKKQGNVLAKKSGWMDADVQLLVKCIVPPNIESQLLQKYGLE